MKTDEPKTGNERKVKKRERKKGRARGKRRRRRRINKQLMATAKQRTFFFLFNFTVDGLNIKTSDKHLQSIGLQKRIQCVFLYLKT